MKEFIAFEGEKFTIEWYYDQKGKSQPLEFFNELNQKEQDKLFMLLRRMGEIGKIFDKTKFRNEGDKIFAFKPQPNRFLSFIVQGRKIIITNGFTKKTQKLPKS